MTRKSQRIRDPLHNVIQFADNDLDQTCWRALNTRPLQRLRRIKQLGFSDYVYPGATHSRLAHSIGVFHTARQLAAEISDRLGGPSNRFDPRKAHVAECAALVHDIGHGPFSHAFEHALDAVKLSRKHETRTEALIRQTELAGVFDEGFDSDFASEVAAVILSSDPANIYASIVSSQFDADRLDYMRRDRLMTGSQQSVVDYEWLLKNLEVRKVNVGIDDENVRQVETLVVNQKGIVAAEGYALSLLYLYINVYLHKTTRGFEKIFSALLERVAQMTIDGSFASTGLDEKHPIVSYLKQPDDVERFLRLDDTVIYGALSQFVDASDFAISSLAIRLRDRAHFECIDVSKIMAAKFEKPDSADAATRAVARNEALVRTAKAAEIVKGRQLTLKREKDVPLVLEDERARRAAYKQRGKLSSIYLIGPDDKLHDLANVSPVVEAAGEFQAYRLYALNDSGKALINDALQEASR
ncbi:MAG TPA: HD domain-containing protein [Caulobacterales bacterium]|nr:HD domain-containing protein [Caulobacterales bacterium]